MLKSKNEAAVEEINPIVNPRGVIIPKAIKINHAFSLEMFVFNRSVIKATATGNW